MSVGRIAALGNHQRFCSADSTVPEYSVDFGNARFLHFGYQRADVEVRERDCAVLQSPRFLERDFWRDHHLDCQLVAKRVLSGQ